MPYPEQEHLMRDLVLNDHAHLGDEPLVVAIYFASRAVPNEECLFEVMRDFGMNEVSEDKTIFQVQFSNAPKLPLPKEDYLRLFLTSPMELRQAAREHWPNVGELRQALAFCQAKVLYVQDSAPDARPLLELLGAPYLMAAAV